MHFYSGAVFCLIDISFTSSRSTRINGMEIKMLRKNRCNASISLGDESSLTIIVMQDAALLRCDQIIIAISK